MTPSARNQEVATDIVDIMLAGYDVSMEQDTIQEALAAYKVLGQANSQLEMEQIRNENRARS